MWFNLAKGQINDNNQLEIKRNVIYRIYIEYRIRKYCRNQCIYILQFIRGRKNQNYWAFSVFIGLLRSIAF